MVPSAIHAPTIPKQKRYRIRCRHLVVGDAGGRLGRSEGKGSLFPYIAQVIKFLIKKKRRANGSTAPLGSTQADQM
jgi:hypothetical protein